MNKYLYLMRDLDAKGMGKMTGFGHSMQPILKSGSRLTYLKQDEYDVGDIVFCKVRGRFIDAHKIIKKNIKRGYLIANNHGHENGWTKKIYGKVIEIDGVPV